MSTTDENFDAVKKMILDYPRRITIREVADDVGISFGSCQAIFMNVFGMKRAASKIVSKLLNFEQKQRRMDDIAQELLTAFNNDPDLLKKVTTGDESWVTPKPPNHFNGKRSATIEELKEESKQELLAIPKHAFQKCFEDWKKMLA